jgi:outer membrane protein assembly factor BamA
MRYGWLLLVGLLTTQTSVAMAARCIDLTTMDETDLLHYRFTPGSEALALNALDTSQRYLIGKVRIVVQPIFDTDRPSEDRRFFRLANRWHTSTRPAVIRHAILFESGSEVRVTTLKESERLLRAKPYLYDARVLPRRLCGDRLDVDVVVRDVWTLTPDIDFSRLGGNNEYGYGLLDTNLLGRGRETSLYFFKDTDRRGVSLGYADPNVAGSRIALSTLLEENSDGSRQVLDVGQPFYSLDASSACLAGSLQVSTMP